jgi:hypothetical protein
VTPLSKALGFAASPAGRKALKQAVQVARSADGKKLIAQAHKVATSPEGKKLIEQARKAAAEASSAAKSPATRDKIDAIRSALAKHKP